MAGHAKSGYSHLTLLCSHKDNHVIKSMAELAVAAAATVAVAVAVASAALDYLKIQL